MVGDGRLPIPEETAGNGEDNGVDRKYPDGKVDDQVDGGVGVFAAAEEEHKKGDGVVNKGEEDL